MYQVLRGGASQDDSTNVGPERIVFGTFYRGPVKIVSAAAQLSGNVLGNKIPQKRKITKQMK